MVLFCVRLLGLLYDTLDFGEVDQAGSYQVFGPFRVSRICKLMERNTLFESLMGKIDSNPELERMLFTLLFVGKDIPFNADNQSIMAATMFGFVKNRGGNVALANRIFEIRGWLKR